MLWVCSMIFEPNVPFVPAPSTVGVSDGGVGPFGTKSTWPTFRSEFLIPLGIEEMEGRFAPFVGGSLARGHF